jgi:transcriptional regulator with XRE-family HTH domain
VKKATELGKKIRELIVKNNLTQDGLAKKLEVTPGTLSNYITGEYPPEMEFLVNCVKEFSLEKEELSNFFYTAFMSTAEHNRKIKIDTRFIDQERLEVLAKILTALALFPTSPNQFLGINQVESLGAMINLFFMLNETEARVYQPPKTDSTPSTDTK